VENKKEPVPAGQPPVDQTSSAAKTQNLGEEIMKMLYERTANPSEAFILVQQMAVMLWEQYQIDWKDQPDSPVAPSRKQRYLDFVSALIDSLLANMKTA
jgi:hypothetical protein